jgi:hypothetical protein
MGKEYGLDFPKIFIQGGSLIFRQIRRSQINLLQNMDGRRFYLQNKVFDSVGYR